MPPCVSEARLGNAAATTERHGCQAMRFTEARIKCDVIACALVSAENSKERILRSDDHADPIEATTMAIAISAFVECVIEQLMVQ
jgi:hypothetical protein